MTILLVTTLPVCIVPAAHAQLFPGPQNLITQPCTSCGPMSVHAADLDEDGDPDVLSASAIDNQIAWYENLGGGEFAGPNVITTSALEAQDVHAADLDGDGDPDVLSASRFDNKIAWYENLGEGDFSGPNVITTAAEGVQSVSAADLDADGDLDVLSSFDGKAVWYENLDGGGFSGQNVLSTKVSASVFADDLDQDGDADILLATSEDDVVYDDVVWFENLGGGEFSNPNVIASDVSYVESFGTGDLDGDGDLDVVSGGQPVAWYENTGGGAFGDKQLIDSELGRNIETADLDSDGDVDLLSTSWADQRISWYENFGGGEFSGRNDIATEVGYVRTVFDVDLDGDGDLDVLSASERKDKIEWFENRLGQSSAGSDGRMGSVFSNGDDLKSGPEARQGNEATPTFGASNGETGFSGRIPIANAEDANSVEAADLDGDGDADVVATMEPSPGEGQVAWYENLDTGGFSEALVITTEVQRPEDVHMADLDEDGDIDVLSASRFGGSKIAWYENLGGGEFSEQKVITTALSGAKSVYAADLDEDGDADVLSASTGNDKIAWYENLDGGGFSEQKVITTTAVNAWSVYAADLTGDGSKDVLSASTGDFDGGAESKISWYENTGDGFSDQNVITTAVEFARSVYAADLDEDGDADVLSASGGDGKVAWYENLDGGGFSDQNEITTSAEGATDVHTADPDGDGDPDVFFASSASNNNRVAWHENLDAGGFSDQKIVTTAAESPRSVSTADLDEDGDPDLLSASRGDDTVAWYENRIAPDQGFASRGAINALPTANGARSVYAEDLDGDGDADVLSASKRDDKIAWYENVGGGFSEQNVITTAADGAQSVYAADLDEDGDADVLSASLIDDKIAWYENLGSGDFSEQNVITTAAGDARAVHAADLTGNGRTDVLSASEGNVEEDPKIAWYENLGGDFSDQNVITTAVEEPWALDAADLDGDGDADVLSASREDDKIAWYENLDSGGFSSQNVITTSAIGTESVFATDLDEDGDPDVLVSLGRGGNAVAWLENLDDGGFSDFHIITTSVEVVTSVYADDLDEDGDADVLSASSFDNKIAWYENLDGGGFSDQNVITTAADQVQSVYAADVGEEGNPDVLSASFNDDKVAWYENQGRDNAPPLATADTFSTPEGQTLAVEAPGVLENDSDPDGDSLLASLVSDVSDGSLTLNTDGSFEYTPDADFVGTDSFTYEASDGTAADTTTASLQITEGQLTRLLALREGWNLLSVPLEVEDPTFGAIMGSLCESGFVFVPGSGYDGIGGEDMLSPGEGFWANCSAGTVEVTGSEPDSSMIDVEEGWNIIGPLADSIAVESITSDPPGIVQTSFFGFDGSGGYQNASALAPGGGYWVKAGESGTLDLSGGGEGAALASKALASTQAASSTQKRSGAKLRLTDAAGREATLRLAKDVSEKRLQRAALPPAPPSGVFDVRFEGGRSVAEVGDGALQAIETQGLEAPVTVELADAEEGQGVQIQQSGEMTRLTAESPSLELASTTDLSVDLQATPDAFALKKTYPNPASGRATVEYALPEPTDVTIAVYDVLGRRVATLADRPTEAGRHTSHLNAGELPSGTYFVRMRAADFQQTRRVTVVR